MADKPLAEPDDGRHMDWADATGRTVERARSSGALASIDTHAETLTGEGLTFVVRIIRNLERKRRAGSAKPVDPFAPPYDPDLLVGGIPPAHVGILNKFPVLDRHLLIVTRENEAQTRLLTEADCEALLRMLHDWDGLAFYNGGPESGASQPHKHLQMVDLPLAPVGPALPVAEALAADNPGDGIGQSTRLPFPHARVRMPPSAWRDPAAGAPVVRALYLDLLNAAGLPADGPEQAGPYNLLATRDWLWLVPRRCQNHEGIEVNALGFAGALLVPDEDHLASLKTMGPAACLRAVCP